MKVIGFATTIFIVIAQSTARLGLPSTHSIPPAEHIHLDGCRFIECNGNVLEQFAREYNAPDMYKIDLTFNKNLFRTEMNSCMENGHIILPCLGTVYTKVLQGSQEALRFRMGGKLSDEDTIIFFEEVDKCPIPKYVERYAFKPVSHSVYHQSKPFDENGIESEYPNNLMADK